MSDHSGDDVETARKGWRPWLGKALFESALIVLSVLLALTLDSWRDSRARARSLEEARASLIEELRFNRALLASDEYLPHHRKLHEIYDGMETSGNTDQANALFRGGVHVAPLRDAAWRIFLSSSVASELPFADRAMLAGIYAGQEHLLGIHQAATGFLIAPRTDYDNPAFLKSFVRSVDLYLTDVVVGEIRLIELYDEGAAKLGTLGP
jgi:hypothetical protein